MPTLLCRRIIEEDFPIQKVSQHSRKEKFLQRGHISSLHIWWARRPLAACRAVILAALLPDPSDPSCPKGFKKKVWKILCPLGQEIPRDPLAIRKAILEFIAEFSDWNNAHNKKMINQARNLVQAAYGHADPLVVDPFAGGGAIPLEALRVGAQAFALDLNPVAVLLNKLIIEYVPHYGRQLLDFVAQLKTKLGHFLEKELNKFYPWEQRETKPIAYLWARFVQCDGPGCGFEYPLLKQLWIGKSENRPVLLELIPDNTSKKLNFKFKYGSNKDLKETKVGTIRNGQGVCPACGFVLTNKRIQLQAKKKNRLPYRLIAVVAKSNQRTGKSYHLPTKTDLQGIELAERVLNQTANQEDLPFERINPKRPSPKARGLSAVTRYGITTFSDLFTPRQLLVLQLLIKKAKSLQQEIENVGTDSEFVRAVQTCLGIAINRLSDRNSAQCRWNPRSQAVAYTFGRQALPMIWDFVEIHPLNYGGGWDGIFKGLEIILENLNKAELKAGIVHNGTATNLPLPDQIAEAVVTDPPYYDAIPYADLSDYFYVWLKRLVGAQFPDLFDSELTPKDEELVVQPSRWVNGNPKDDSFFENGMKKALMEAKRILKEDGIAVVVFAHKTTTGWEAMLKAILDAGWMITASWPIDTESATRLASLGQSRLMSSIHLVCRPRPKTSAIGDWREILAQLQPRIHAWMKRLVKENIVGADAIFACIGPALELFSRFDRVETASGEVIPLGGFLEQVWEVVAKEALNMIFSEVDPTGFEEDSRLTAMWLWTLTTQRDTHKESGKDMFTIDYDTARKLAQAIGVHLDELGKGKFGGILEIKGNRARLLSVLERKKSLFPTSKSAIKINSAKKRGMVDTKKANQKSEFLDQVDFAIQHDGTTLDYLHQCMLLFGEGRNDVIKYLLKKIAAGSALQFWKLAQALSALYPPKSKEKRWLDGLLASCYTKTP